MLLCQHWDIFPKMHIVSIQIGDVFIGVHRKLHERSEVGPEFWPRPLRLHGWSSWLVKLLFFRRTLAGKHVRSQAATQGSPSQYGCRAEGPIEGRAPPPWSAIPAKIPRPAQNRSSIQKKKKMTFQKSYINVLHSSHLPAGPPRSKLGQWNVLDGAQHHHCGSTDTPSLGGSGVYTFRSAEMIPWALFIGTGSSS